MYPLKRFYTRVVYAQRVLSVEFDKCGQPCCVRCNPGFNPGHGSFSNNLIQYDIALTTQKIINKQTKKTPSETGILFGRKHIQ